MKTVVNPKNGNTYDSPFKADGIALAALGNLIKGPLKDNDFAKSIYNACSKTETATPGRIFWMHKLAGEPPQSNTAKPLKKLHLEKLATMLTAAGVGGLKNPSIVLTTPSKIEVKLHIAGEKSKYTGAVMVSSTSFKGPYYGRVMTDGQFFPGRDFTPEVGELLNELATDPKSAAAHQGHVTGRCCFCRKVLDDPTSTRLGYGPVCAKRFGLLHTVKQAKKVARFASGNLFEDMAATATKKSGKRALNKLKRRGLAEPEQPKAKERVIIRKIKRVIDQA